jgi:hypothetical protein
MRILALLLRLIISCCALSLPQAGRAEKRGFVLGINAYDKGLPALATPISDAVAVEEALRDVGFKIDRLGDATLTQFSTKWREFLGSLTEGDTVAFYFAGHGVQVDGANYLILKDTPWINAQPHAILDGSLNLWQLMQELDARKVALALYILDACRKSPFEDKAPRAPLGQARVFAALERMDGTFVMYSAGPGEQALDSLPKEAHSPYARRLIPLLRNKDLSLQDIAIRVKVEVEQDTGSVGQKQRPAYYDGTSGYYYLAREVPGGLQRPSDANNAIRLGGYATWDTSCRSRPAPRVNSVGAPQFGRIVTRFESFTIAGKHAGTVSCENTTQKGTAVYYLVDDAFKSSLNSESVQLSIRHWSLAPPETVTETFNVDLGMRYGRRIPGR